MSKQYIQTEQQIITYQKLSPELLLNPSFESGTTFPDNWVTYISGTPPTFLYPVTPGNNNTGTAVGISYPVPPNPAPADHSFSAIMQSTSISDQKVYHISGYIKTDTLSPVGAITWDTGARIMVDWRDVNNTVLSSSEIMTPVYGNPIGWTKYEYDITPASTAVTANIVALLADVTGAAYFDDISFTELSLLTITFPSVTDTLILNNTYDITWTYSGNEGTNVKLDLYKSSYSTTIPILEITPSTPIGNYGLGTYSWQLPTTSTTLPEGTDYTIRITNTTDTSSTSDSNPFAISSTICLTPVSEFSFQTQSDGKTVYFDSTLTSNNPTSYNWYFDDGNTNNEANPFHTFQSDGNYLVSLLTTNSCGDGTTAFHTVTISTSAQSTQPTAETASITSGMSNTTKNILYGGLVIAGIAIIYLATKPKE